MIKQVVKQMVTENAYIDSAQTVKNKVLETSQLNVSVVRVQKTMSKDLDMSFSRIKNISLLGNSVNNLVMR